MENVSNEIFTIKIKVEDGKLYYGLYCEAKAIDLDYTFAYDFVQNGYVHHNYFKTGNYYINDNNDTEAAQIKLYGVISDYY